VRTKLDIMLSLLAATSFTFNSRLILTENIFLCQVYYRSFNHIIWCGHQKVEMTLKHQQMESKIMQTSLGANTPKNHKQDSQNSGNRLY
jgi:hypothetical protein